MKTNQISESIELGILMAISGGIMDAYSYLFRGQVFANAQTGNILLFGVSLSEGNFSQAMQYACPILAFSIGIMLADFARIRLKKMLHWRQYAVFMEAIILLFVGFIPTGYNLLANSLTSLACGIQVESFRKIHGKGMATTMCIGNLRSATQNMCDFLDTRKKSALHASLLYYGIIVCFTLGAVLGSKCMPYLQVKTIWLSVFFLGMGFFLMFMDQSAASAYRDLHKKR